ncbi:putative oxidoreductase with FAD/NAD(P)-binding domain [Candidatus Methylobacter favarea]|uniref:Putative oxidoreductase with FAD/NAD(P)-binding domain n=1 Tax=Candidatus Methylobacter favarea TaxID=2707345 RepID=A0A8S0WM02_9GAMM|nr:NAD(P)/FAD-dependent oxidoreductase [Candidatus Methylobacter favarea]CAA9892980.1 putative oxidoreductase with FAD/NAD(P)-binding domain [Candidatus Methylobacter favarea]
MIETDVIIIGAGAAGLMCAIEAGKRARRVRVLDHANKAGKKILMSGGGRCNFTNYFIEPGHFISTNPDFCKSPLSRYSPWDFLALIEKYRIAFHEKDHGQLFCNESARSILAMLLSECAQAGVIVQLNTRIDAIERLAKQFYIKTGNGGFVCKSLVIATGGLSIPKMGATPLGYKIAEQFGIPVVSTRAGLVPLTLHPADKDKLSPLSGIAQPCLISNKNQSFQENILFTHRGLSGPAVLQISSYWQPGEELIVNLLPQVILSAELKSKRRQKIKSTLKTILDNYLPRRLIRCLLNEDLLNLSLQDLSDRQLQQISDQLQNWSIRPNGTEGYRTAEVTLGGVDCNAISSKTMESKKIAGLYFIGEVMDVTGWLGGYNFQWAWSSGWCAGQYV